MPLSKCCRKLDHYKHHHIVYGRVENLDLSLIYQTYFSKVPSENLESMLTSGIQLKDFIEYVEEFTALKNSDSDESGGLTFNDYAMVAGVTNECNIVECKSLDEFRLEHNLVLANEDVNTQTHGLSL